jgi:hypothetical protein
LLPRHWHWFGIGIAFRPDALLTARGNAGA